MEGILETLKGLPRPVKILAVVVLVVLLVFLGGKLFGFERYWWAVAAGLLVIALLVAAFDALVRKGEERRGAAFEGELRRESEKGGASKQEVREALRELSAKLDEAVKQLKTTGLSIYSLPWYLLIGEPQSGKSTTLKNSGLEFPLGGEGLSGSGGTRNCDWWFANEAVILDTAGRFTFQEEAAPDASEWSAFLKLLKRYRRDCPINGVLVVVPSTSLLEDAPEEQEKKAQNIRQKLLHLQRVLEIRFPVFLLITKADRILGFSEFFSKLDPVDQKQLVGWSNPLGPEKPYDVKSFDGVWDDLVTRIHKLRLKFTANEEILQNVDRIFVFPEELRHLREPLRRYVQTIFLETRFDEPFVFRGLYLSSGVQQGKPIARATRELLGSAAEGVLENLEQLFKRSRAFFIKDFYEKKVFPEQGLVARTRAAQKRERQTLWLVRGLAALIVLVVVVGMVPAFVSLRSILGPITTDVRAAQDCIQKEPCSVPAAWRISERLYRDQADVQRHPFLFAMFFRGAGSGELNQLLSGINQKLLLGRVVNPALREAEARSGALGWETIDAYPAFLGAFESLLRFWALQKPVPGGKPLVVPAELRLTPLAQFIQATKGTPATPRSKELDEWAAAVGSDATPDNALAAALRVPLGPDALQAPAMDRPVKAFEDFWSVASLARWDTRLNQLLGLWVQRYGELLKIDEPAARSQLDRSAQTGKEFKKLTEELAKHLGTPRPGSKDFPGMTSEAWARNLDAQYARILRFGPVVSLISEARRDELKQRIVAEARGLEESRAGWAHVVEPDAKDPARRVLTPAASAVSSLVVGVTDYADVAAFEAAENPKGVVEEAAKKTTPGDQKALVDGFAKKQQETKTRLTEGLKTVAALPPPVAASFQAPELTAFVSRTADLGYLFRVLPWAQTFLDRSIGPGCAENVCYQRSQADLMIPFGVEMIRGVEGSSVASRADVEQMAQTAAGTMLDYLRRYVARSSRSRGGGGGGGFQVPASLLRASSWREFLGAATAWNAEGEAGGADGGAPVDTSGALTFPDIQRYADMNRRLNPIIGYFRSLEGGKAGRGGADKTPAEVAAAVGQFKAAVLPLPEQELKAWRQLSLGLDGASLKGYHAFSRNAAVRRSVHGRQLEAVERRGANLIRDAIRPSFSQAQEVSVRRLRECCTGQFPFVRESQLRQDRLAFASGTLAKLTAGAAGAAVLRLDLPSIGTAQITGPLAEAGLLADDYALDPILSGSEPDFDFTGESRAFLSVARRWQQFLYGGTAGAAGAGGAVARSAATPREHQIEVRMLPVAPLAGRRPLGERVGLVFAFDRNVVIRPSTDLKAGGRKIPPFVWRMPQADAPAFVQGRNEDSKGGWTGSLEVYGGPLRFFQLVRLAAEDRAEAPDDPSRGRVWTIRIPIPDAERRSETLEGTFELIFDEPLPGVLPN